MHISSLDNMRKFIEKYMDKSVSYKILDIGSQEVDGDENGSYRHLFQCDNWQYFGADVVSGKNVDIVLNKPYRWKNIKDKSFDCVVCGQMLEHCEFFWLTILEIRRILKENGICCIIAPSGGPEHRYPVDCYRYYPDGLKAIAKYAQLETLECYAQWNQEIYPEMDCDWRDCVLVCKRPKESFWNELRTRINHKLIWRCSKDVCAMRYGNNYSQETTWRFPLPNLYSALYFDTGVGFNEGQVERNQVRTYQRYRHRYVLSKDCKMVRFDPLEGYTCVVKNLKITFDDGSATCQAISSNGEEGEFGELFFWNTHDPQIFIPVAEGVGWVEIEADIHIIC